MPRRFLMLMLVLLLGTQPVQAQKGTPPPTPEPAAPPQQPTPPSAAAPTSTKVLAPPTPIATATAVPPTPLPPTATAASPTPTAAEPTVAVQVSPPPTSRPENIATLPHSHTPPPILPTASPPPIAENTWAEAKTGMQRLPSWALVIAGAGGIGILLLGIWLIVRFVHYTRQDLKMKQRMIAEDAATRLAAHRHAVEVRLGDPHAWRHIVGQIITDVLNRPVRIRPDEVPVLNGEILYFTVAEDRGPRYTFTIDAERMRQLKLIRSQDRVIPLESMETHVELLAIWAYLAAQGLPGAAPAIPRQARWTMIERKNS